MSHAIGDRELRGQPVVDQIEVGGLTRQRMDEHRELIVRGAKAVLARELGGLDRRMRAKAARRQLDPVALDRARGVAWARVDDARLGPACSQYRREAQRTVNGAPIRGRPGVGQQCRLHAGSGREADLDRLGVGTKGSARAAGAQQAEGDCVLALCRGQT